MGNKTFVVVESVKTMKILANFSSYDAALTYTWAGWDRLVVPTRTALEVGSVVTPSDRLTRLIGVAIFEVGETHENQSKGVRSS